MGNEQSNDGKVKKTMSKGKMLAIVITASIAIITGIIFGYFMNIKNEVDSWADKIYPGVQAYGIDLGGKTKEEAIDIMNDQLISLIGDKVIAVTIGDKTFELKYSDISPSVSADETVEEALDYGKDKKMLQKKKIIENGVDYKVNTVLSYDEEKVKEFVNSINEQVKVDAVNTKILINGSNISITPGVLGKQ